jgi:hypothetical protein
MSDDKPTSSKSTKYTEKYWKDQLTRSRDAHKDFFDRGDESLDVYSRRKSLTDVKRELGVWWYIIETILPVYCSRIPKVEVQLRKKAGSIYDQIASISLERATQFALDEHFDFLSETITAAKSFLLTGRGILWARYDARMRDEAIDYPVMQDPNTGQILDFNGNPIDTKNIEIEQEEDGSLVAHERLKAKDDEVALLESIYFKDFLVSPARAEREVEWKSRRAYLDRDEVEEKFGSKIAQDVKYDIVPEDVKRNTKLRDSYATEGKAEFFEVWCKKSGKVYWINERGSKTIIESSEPPLAFVDFFPCVEINANLDTTSIVPVSDYWHVRDTVLEIERLTTRMHGLVQAIRVSGVYDSTFGDDLEQLLSGDFVLRPMKRWPSYKTKGGMASMIEMFDINPYVNALQTVADARERALQNLYEVMKASDIVRGVTDAQETAAAQELKSGWSSFGLRVRQNQFTKFVSDGITKVAHIIATQFDEPHIASMCDADELLSSAQLDPAAQGATWPAIAESIKQGVEGYRIQITSDSLVQMNEQQEKSERMELLGATGQFLQQAKDFIAENPAMAPYAGEMMRFVNRSFKAGKELEATLDGSISAVTQAVEASANQPPPPDPTVIQAQSDLQIAQIQAQTKENELMMNAQIKSQESAISSAKAEVEFQVKREEIELKKQELMLAYEKLQVEQAKIGAEIEIAKTKVQLDTEKAQGEMDKNSVQFQFDSYVAKSDMQAEQQRLAIESYRVKLVEYEKLLEERRLSEQHNLERQKLSESKKLPPIHINVDANKPTKSRKRAKVIRDEKGDLAGVEYEDGE